MKAKQIVEVATKNKSFISKFPSLFRMFKVALQGKYKLGLKNLAIFVLLIAYVLSPIDLIPEFFVGFGILDDITITLFAMSKLFAETDKFTEWEKNQKNTVTVE